MRLDKTENYPNIGQPKIAKLDRKRAILAIQGSETKHIPIDYETANRPCVVAWDGKNAYRQKMAKQFALPILEGLVVVKEKGEMKSLLA